MTSTGFYKLLPSYTKMEFTCQLCRILIKIFKYSILILHVSMFTSGNVCCSSTHISFQSRGLFQCIKFLCHRYVFLLCRPSALCNIHIPENRLVFQQDNIPCHQSCLFRDGKKITLIIPPPWNEYSDLSTRPMEHLSDAVWEDYLTSLNMNLVLRSVQSYLIYNQELQALLRNCHGTVSKCYQIFFLNLPYGIFLQTLCSCTSFFHYW